MNNQDTPNILLIMTDEQRADHVGFGGHPLLHTPNLDALAAGGMRFDRAFVANPICMPNRSSILTGRVPSVHGTRVNGISLDPDSMTFARALRAEGYRTGLVGKSHLQNLGHGSEQVGAWLDHRSGDAVRRSRQEGWDRWENVERHRAEYVAVPPDFYGFDHVRLTGGNSASATGHYYQWLLEQGVDPARLQGRANASRAYASWEQVWQTAMPEDLYPTNYIADECVDFLEHRSTDDRPFLLWCSFPDPHHPFAPPERLYDMYAPDDVPVPESFGDTHERSLPHYRAMVARRGQPQGPFTGWAVTEEQYRVAAAVQFGMITMIDEAVGRILAALRRQGLDQSTVVIVTSDHGDMFGDHGLMLKHAMHYEACTRVPLVVRAPGYPAGACDSLVSSLDIASTILDLCGCDAYRGMQGRSLVPLLTEPAGRLRESLLVEEDEVFGLSGLPGPIRMRTLITEHARLTTYAGQQGGELFDLDSDALEMNNLWDRDRARSMRAELAERLNQSILSYMDDGVAPTHTA
ncbi:sulfatase-like hydrolase/transferase [Haloechinothrix sp. YIM 98757]|uniref:Sulfatase-like hydrolase/transferase n=1 Tax=Haloechinothrix aidingensis TaxID=2752311 RepID=A0A838AAX7_9PSEU|nr:sulfatase-like hydrolase/transferase [Haloechinothrix aidingensis]MBA0126399.1 sulfatase-like hydrolase/transferase [Haloechinothrix aidingensis]